jgi:hypothetical protein
MIRRPFRFDLAWLPALLAALATSWAMADEPFPFPAPPLRSKPVYLSPDPLPALPAPNAQPAAKPPTATSTPHVPAPSGIRKAQAVQEVAAPPRGGLVPPVRKSVVPDTTETDRRVERLKRQLEELNDLLSRPPVDPPVIERPIVIPPGEPAPAYTERPLIKHEPSTPTHAPLERSHVEPTHNEPAPKPQAPENAKSLSTGLIKGLPTSAIDRVYVADNLFAAGEYALANDIYCQVDRRSISGDESGWVEFQLANCSRRLGRLDDAKKRYRRVVADPTLGWLQDLAKWRLDAIDEREQLVKEHARLEAAIQQSTEVPRVPAKK